MSHLFYLSTAARPVLDRAEGIYMWDTTGRRFIDGSSGAMVSNIGHSNPVVLAAMQAQMARSTFGYRLHFETEPGERLAAKVASLSPAGMEKVFFVSGGSEAVESAIKLARQWAVVTGQGSRWKVISRFPSYHGSTLGALSVTGYDPLTDPFRPMMVDMPKIPAPRAWLDGLDKDDPATGAHYAAMLEAEILAQGPDTVLAFIQEPVGGASTGALVPPAGYMQAVREICTKHGILLIHDEVMSGGGRVGAFLGGDLWGSCRISWRFRRALARAMCRWGRWWRNRPLWMRCRRRGIHAWAYLCGQSAGLRGGAGGAGGNPGAGDDGECGAGRRGAEGAAFGADAALWLHWGCAGRGLLLAFEFVADRETRAPLPREMKAFDDLVERAYAEGLIIYSRRSRGGMRAIISWSARR